MTTATKIEHTNTNANGLIEDAGGALNRIGRRIIGRLVELGEMSSNARNARQFAYLYGLTDDDLAARGLKREDLALHCFGAKIYL